MRYRYMGPDLTLDDANPDYYLNLYMGDEFDVSKATRGYVLYHQDPNSKGIPFTLTAAEYKSILKDSEVYQALEPDPANPPYLLFDATVESARQLYDHYNKTLFDGKCPTITFKQTRSRTSLGVAVLQWLRGKPVFTMQINSKVLVDRKLFTDTLIHEMIHLYLYKKGLIKIQAGDPSGTEELHAQHGPLFTSEMNRINQQGFHLTVVADDSVYKQRTADDFYAVVVQVPRVGWLSWYAASPFTPDLLDAIKSGVQERYTNQDMVLFYVRSTNRHIIHGTHLSGKSVPKSSFDKVLSERISVSDYEEVIQKETLKPLTVKYVPDYKEAPELYVLSYSEFHKRMERYGADDDLLLKKWLEMPPSAVVKEVEPVMSNVVGKLRRDTITPEKVVTVLTDLRSRLERKSPAAYQTAIRKLVDKYNTHDILKPYFNLLGIK